jgi:hypothetical protein
MCQQWELLSWIAASISPILTIIGFGVVIVQLHQQGKQLRLAALDVLYTELDTHQARLAREFIYNSGSDVLRFGSLHKAANSDQRKYVEDTLATLERIAYKIVTKQVPSQDAFNLYGGVFLGISNKTWAYIEDQRDIRKKNKAVHQLIYRRYLEEVIKLWIPKYCKEVGIKPPQREMPTKEQLEYIFTQVV